jgi:hypothetical protein
VADKIKVYSAGSQIDLTGLSLYKDTDTTLQTEVTKIAVVGKMTNFDL